MNWIPKGHVFPAGAWPDWAFENMWAPEIHFVNGTFVVYFTGGWVGALTSNFVYRRKCVAVGGASGSRWRCCVSIRVALGTLH